MSRVALDLNMFKHVKSDKHTTTLRHKDGHTLTISHSSLSPDYRAQLESLSKAKMAEGGEVEEDPKKKESTLNYNDLKKEYYEKNKSKAKPTESLNYPELQKQYSEKKKKLAEEDRSKPKKYADGGDVETPYDIINKETSRPSDNVDLGNFAPLETLQSLGGEAKYKQAARQAELSKEGTDPRMLQDIAAGYNPSQVRSEATPVQPAVPQQAPNVAAPNQQFAGQQQAPGPAIAPMGAQPQQPTTPEPGSLEAKYGSMEHGMREEAAGQMAEQAAMGRAGAEKAKQQQAFQSELENNTKTFQESYKKLADEGAALKADIAAGHIDPNRYLSSMSTGSKLATGIGLLLGGMGSGLTGQPNMALQYLEKQIDNDVMAQQKDMDKKQNLLRYTTEQMGNLKDGYQAAKIYSMEMLSSRLQQIDANTQDPVAKARIAQVKGQLDQKLGQMQFQLGQAMAVNKILNGVEENPSNTAKAEALLTQLRQTDPEKAKQLEPLIVPGVGVGKVPVPQNVRDQMIQKQTFGDSLQHFYDWAQKHSGSMNPKDVIAGKTMAAEMQSMYRNAINGGVFKEGEQKFIDSIIDSDPTKFFNSIRVLPKLKEVLHANTMQLNGLKSGYGMKTNAPQSSQTQGFTFTPSKR